MAAAAAVFATPELLESILLHLPDKQMLAAKRVSTTFQAQIESSSKILKRLFLLDKTDDQPTYWTEYFPSNAVTSYSGTQPPPCIDGKQYTRRRLVYNRSVLAPEAHFRAASPNVTLCSKLGFVYQLNVFRKNYPGRGRDYTNDSRLRMLVSQPARRESMLIAWLRQYGEVRRSIRNEDGVAFKDLLDGVLSIRRLDLAERLYVCDVRMLCSCWKMIV